MTTANITTGIVTTTAPARLTTRPTITDRRRPTRRSSLVRLRPVVRTFGVLTIGHGRPIEMRRRAQELLAILAHHRTIERSAAAAMLWPDKPPADAGTNLRVTLGHLHRSVAPAVGTVRWLHVCSGTLALAVGAVEIDLDEFQRMVRRMRSAERAGDADSVLRCARQALAWYRGDYLAGIDADFCMFERIRLQTVAYEVAVTGATVASRVGQHDLAVDLACRGLAIEPLGDAAASALIDALAARGCTSAAEQARERHRAALIEAGLDARSFAQRVERVA